MHDCDFIANIALEIMCDLIDELRYILDVDLRKNIQAYCNFQSHVTQFTQRLHVNLGFISLNLSNIVCILTPKLNYMH